MGVRLKNVCYSYGAHMVLNNISLNISSGEHIGILGESGCGKSTLLKLLSGLYEPQSGIIEVEGKQTSVEIRKEVAIVMQNPLLLPASIRENITCGHPLKEEILKEACDAAKLTEWISTLPQGLETFVGERGNKISGGQAGRIAIARAIAKQAPIVLLDEATSALDGNTSNAVLLALSYLMKDKTVISVTHHPETLSDCNRVYRLEGGNLYALRIT